MADLPEEPVTKQMRVYRESNSEADDLSDDDVSGDLSKELSIDVEASGRDVLPSYNELASCSRYRCNQCDRLFPNDHWLDCHLEETHDQYFMLMAPRRKLFRCLMESCGSRFRSPTERDMHLKEVHKYPPEFCFSEISVESYRDGQMNSPRPLSDTASSSPRRSSSRTGDLSSSSTGAQPCSPRPSRNCCSVLGGSSFLGGGEVSPVVQLSGEASPAIPTATRPLDQLPSPVRIAYKSSISYQRNISIPRTLQFGETNEATFDSSARNVARSVSPLIDCGRKRRWSESQPQAVDGQSLLPPAHLPPPPGIMIPVSLVHSGGAFTSCVSGTSSTTSTSNGSADRYRPSSAASNSSGSSNYCHSPKGGNNNSQAIPLPVRATSLCTAASGHNCPERPSDSPSPCSSRSQSPIRPTVLPLANHHEASQQRVIGSPRTVAGCSPDTTPISIVPLKKRPTRLAQRASLDSPMLFSATRRLGSPLGISAAGRAASWLQRCDSTDSCNDDASSVTSDRKDSSDTEMDVGTSSSLPCHSRSATPASVTSLQDIGEPTSAGGPASTSDYISGFSVLERYPSERVVSVSRCGSKQLTSFEELRTSERMSERSSSTDSASFQELPAVFLEAPSKGSTTGTPLAESMSSADVHFSSAELDLKQLGNALK